jgi:hypothetical protein
MHPAHDWARKLAQQGPCLVWKINCHVFSMTVIVIGSRLAWHENLALSLVCFSEHTQALKTLLTIARMPAHSCGPTRDRCPWVQDHSVTGCRIERCVCACLDVEKVLSSMGLRGSALCLFTPKISRHMPRGLKTMEGVREVVGCSMGDTGA